MLGNDAPLDLMANFFKKLPGDEQIHLMCREGNLFGFDRDWIKELMWKNVHYVIADNKCAIIYKSYPTIISLLQNLTFDDLVEFFELLVKCLD